MTKREALAQIDGSIQFAKNWGSLDNVTIGCEALKIARDALAGDLATAEAVEPDLRHDDYDGAPERYDEGKDV